MVRPAAYLSYTAPTHHAPYGSPVSEFTNFSSELAGLVLSLAPVRILARRSIFDTPLLPDSCARALPSFSLPSSPVLSSGGSRKVRRGAAPGGSQSEAASPTTRLVPPPPPPRRLRRGAPGTFGPMVSADVGEGSGCVSRVRGCPLKGYPSVKLFNASVMLSWSSP